MRQLCRDLLTAVLLGLVLPGCLLNYAVLWMDVRAAPVAETAQTAQTQPKEIPLPVLLKQAHGTEEMDMDEYLVGVVLAEMPAYFQPEALKAQAVAARTYARKAYLTGGKHGDGSVCGDSGCCQAYLHPGDYLARGGTMAGIEKVRLAVEGTSGYVLTYQGQLIEATYFSSAGGTTEDAVAVWGTDYPYLQSVPSPEEAAWDTVVMTPQEFGDKLSFYPEGSPEDWFGTVVYTTGGGVQQMEIGGELFTGQKLRSLLGLKSTAFTVAVEGDSIRITTRGYGHRVGMSQYGAETMALTGSTYADILAHYYPGAVLTRVDG